jgi:hypothetical protein
MKRMLFSMLAVLASAAAAQEGIPGAVPDPAEDPEFAAMVAQAAKPGDDALTCEQLQEELDAMGTDPQAQKVMQEQGAYFQEQLGKAQGAQQQAAAAAETANAGADAEKNVEDMVANVEKTLGLVPQAMRGARIFELGEAKGCDFAAEETPAQ